MKGFGRSLMAVVLLWLWFGNMTVKAEEDNATIDFVLVIDCTGSLSDSDPYKWGVKAAQLFVETLPIKNVRVSVIAFGPQWDTEEVYTAEGEEQSFSRVTEAFPLAESGEKESNKRICSVLERIGNEDGDYTPIGDALSAAVDVLEQGKAAENSACIILVSDGRITGQYDTQDGQRYESIENAIGIASSNDWPVYCLELNYDKLNAGNETEGLLAREQLDHISESTGGERIEVTGTNAILNKFIEIIKRYFGVKSNGGTYTIEDEKVTLPFEVTEMTAETNIIVTGEELNQIDRIEITDPDKNTEEYRGNSHTENRRVIFDIPPYITGKLINPQEGQWLITVYGDDGVDIEIQIIPLREVGLELTAGKDLSEGVYRNEEIEFTAHFVYNGQSYSSDTFYRDSKAYLEILETGDKFPLEGGNDNYKGVLSFERAGNYTVQAVVEDGIFRNDRKVSESCSIEVKVDSMPLEASIPEQTMAVGSRLVLDCSGYFSGENGKQVTYEVSFDKAMPLKCSITQEGVLTIEAGEKAGTAEIAVFQKDVDLEEPAVQKFPLVVTNEKPQVIGEGAINVELIAGGNAVLEKAASVFGLKLQKEKVLDLGMYFADPEGLPLRYEREYEETSRAFSAEIDESRCVLVLRAEESGDGTVRLHAVDCCGEVSEKIAVHVNVLGGGAFFFRHTWAFWVGLIIIFLAAGIILAAAFGKCQLYGTWEVTINYGATVSGSLRQYKQGRKCKLSELINTIQPCDFQSMDVMVCAGNGITKKVFFKGLDQCRQLTVKKEGEELKDVRMLVCDRQSRELIEFRDANGNVARFQRIS